MKRFCHLNDPGPKGAPEDYQGCWLPTEKVGCQLLTTPKLGEKKLQSMVPWLLEEHVLQAPDQLAWIAGDRDSTGKLPVITASKEFLDDCRQSLLEKGMQCEKLVPDFFMLPWQEGRISLAVIGGRLLVRNGPFQGMAGPVNWLLPLLINQLDENTEWVFFGTPPEQIREISGVRVEIRSDLQGDIQPQHPWPGFPGHKLNSKSKHPSSMEALTAGLAAALLIVILIGYAVETSRINRQATLIGEALHKAVTRATGETIPVGTSIRSYFSSKRDERHEDRNRDSLTTLKNIDGLLAGCPNCQITNIKVDREGLFINIENTPAVEAWFASQDFTGHDERIFLTVAENDIRLKVPNRI